MLYFSNPANGHTFAVTLGRDPFDQSPILLIYRSGDCLGHAPVTERPASFLKRLREIRKVRRRHGYELTFVCPRNCRK
jgi:hypothetical protein